MIPAGYQLQPGDRVSCQGVVKYPPGEGFTEAFVTLPGSYTDIRVNPDCLTLLNSVIAEGDEVADRMDVNVGVAFPGSCAIVLGLAEGNAWVRWLGTGKNEVVPEGSLLRVRTRADIKAGLPHPFEPPAPLALPGPAEPADALGDEP